MNRIDYYKSVLAYNLDECLNGSSGQASNTGDPDEKNRAQLVKDKPGADKPAGRMISVRSLISQIYQPASWQSAGNGANLEPPNSSRAGKNRTSSAADKKRRRCRSCSRTRLKMKSNQLDDETS
ncbi:hypothetical protein F511_43843 [Dorcoceras hygrometricum]|uniref:Uncharacterized protein n=1 Tax=Dorcoceras hygrometricum TaxID=472368 RepID=A0A2Z6ZYD9_9LAMI|nr:hypothetical protein F511_43843 [Dorcoceras hygrometricum]